MLELLKKLNEKGAAICIDRGIGIAEFKHLKNFEINEIIDIIRLLNQYDLKIEFEGKKVIFAMKGCF